MYIQNITIHRYKVLQDITINFQAPSSATADPDTGNVVNIVAGVNGCGKTSLLLALSYLGKLLGHKHLVVTMAKIPDHDAPVTFKKSNRHEYLLLESKFSNNNQGKFPPYDDPRIIYLPTQQSFDYSAKTQLDLRYHFHHTIEVRDVLGNAELYIKEYIINQERKSTASDPKARTQSGVDAFNEHFKDAQLLTKVVDLDFKRLNRPVFANAAGEHVTIDQLSDGEKQLYGRVIALMMLEPRNSVILIDEPEISLHPAWQQEIMGIYAKIGFNNQFIVATHSPQIIASVPYQNLILLSKQNDKIVPVECQHPPAGLDVNSILTEVMGADKRPKKIDELYLEYRRFVEEQKEETDEAKAVKAKILQMENLNSEFMQEMNFLIELRD